MMVKPIKKQNCIILLIQFLINIYTYTFILSIFEIPLLADTLKGSFSVIALRNSDITVVSFGPTLIYVCKSKLMDKLS